MSHFDKLVRLPEGFVVVAKTANSEFAGIAHQSKPIFGVFFHHKVDSRHSSPHSIIHWPRCYAFAHLSFSLRVTYEPPLASPTVCSWLTQDPNRRAIPPRARTRMHISSFLPSRPHLSTNMMRLIDSPRK